MVLGSGVMLYLLVSLIAIDVILTLIGLHDGHTEQNKLMAWLIARLGATAALLCSHGAAIALTLIFPPSGYWLYGFTAVWALLAGTNIYRLMKPPTTP
jgi:hypothetical protein